MTVKTPQGFRWITKFHKHFLIKTNGESGLYRLVDGKPVKAEAPSIDPNKSKIYKNIENETFREDKVEALKGSKYEKNITEVLYPVKTIKEKLDRYKKNDSFLSVHLNKYEKETLQSFVNGEKSYKDTKEYFKSKKKVTDTFLSNLDELAFELSADFTDKQKETIDQYNNNLIMSPSDLVNKLKENESPFTEKMENKVKDIIRNKPEFKINVNKENLSDNEKQIKNYATHSEVIDDLAATRLKVKTTDNSLHGKIDNNLTVLGSRYKHQFVLDSADEKYLRDELDKGIEPYDAIKNNTYLKDNLYKNQGEMLRVIRKHKGKLYENVGLMKHNLQSNLRNFNMAGDIQDITSGYKLSLNVNDLNLNRQGQSIEEKKQLEKVISKADKNGMINFSPDLYSDSRGRMYEKNEEHNFTGLKEVRHNMTLPVQKLTDYGKSIYKKVYGEDVTHTGRLVEEDYSASFNVESNSLTNNVAKLDFSANNDLYTSMIPDVEKVLGKPLYQNRVGETQESILKKKRNVLKSPVMTKSYSSDKSPFNLVGELYTKELNNKIGINLFGKNSKVKNIGDVLFSNIETKKAYESYKANGGTKTEEDFKSILEEYKVKSQNVKQVFDSKLPSSTAITEYINKNRNRSSTNLSMFMPDLYKATNNTSKYMSSSNKGDKDASPNYIHSHDAFTAREIIRMGSLSKSKLNSIRYNTSTSKKEDKELNEFIKVGKESGFLSSKALRILTNESYNSLSNQDKRIIMKEMDRIEGEPFEILSVHDAFLTHPNNHKRLRKYMTDVIQKKADTKGKLLKYTIEQWIGRKKGEVKFNIPISNSNYIIKDNHKLSKLET